MPTLEKNQHLKNSAAIPLDCVQDVDDLISDLHAAKKKAKQTGTLRRVYRMTPDGSNKVTFNLHFSLTECVK